MNNFADISSDFIELSLLGELLYESGDEELALFIFKVKGCQYLAHDGFAKSYPGPPLKPDPHDPSLKDEEFAYILCVNRENGSTVFIIESRMEDYPYLKKFELSKLVETKGTFDMKSLYHFHLERVMDAIDYNLMNDEILHSLEWLKNYDAMFDLENPQPKLTDTQVLEFTMERLGWSMQDACTQLECNELQLKDTMNGFRPFTANMRRNLIRLHAIDANYESNLGE